MDDIASPPQLKQALEEIEELKEFKTKSITAFMVIQALMAAAVAMTNMY